MNRTVLLLILLLDSFLACGQLKVMGSRKGDATACDDEIDPLTYRRILREDFSKLTTPEFNPSTQNRLLVSSTPQMRVDGAFVPGKPEFNPILRFNGFIEASLTDGVATLFQGTQLQPGVRTGLQIHANLVTLLQGIVKARNRLWSKKPEWNIPKYPYYFDCDERRLFRTKINVLQSQHGRQDDQTHNQFRTIQQDLNQAEAELQLAISDQAAKKNTRDNPPAGATADQRQQYEVDLAKAEKKIIEMEDKKGDLRTRFTQLQVGEEKRRVIQKEEAEALAMQIPFRARQHYWLTLDLNALGQNYYLFDSSRAIASHLGKQSFVGFNHALRLNGIQFSTTWNWYGAVSFKWGQANNLNDLDGFTVKAQQNYATRTTKTETTKTTQTNETTDPKITMTKTTDDITSGFTDQSSNPNRDVKAFRRRDYAEFRYEEWAAQVIFFNSTRTFGIDLQGARRHQKAGDIWKPTGSVGVGLIALGVNKTSNNAVVSGELLVTFRDLANAFPEEDTPVEWFNRRMVTFRVAVPFF